jgi:hypothetical protein
LQLLCLYDMTSHSIMLVLPTSPRARSSDNNHNTHILQHLYRQRITCSDLCRYHHQLHTMAIATRPITNDDAPVRIRSNRLHRPLLMAAYALHFISSAIVLSIAMYFLSKIKEVFDRENHTHGLILYWTIVVCMRCSLSQQCVLNPTTGRRCLTLLSHRTPAPRHQILQRLPCPSDFHLLNPMAHRLHSRYTGIQTP